MTKNDIEIMRRYANSVGGRDDEAATVIEQLSYAEIAAIIVRASDTGQPCRCGHTLTCCKCDEYVQAT